MERSVKELQELIRGEEIATIRALSEQPRTVIQTTNCVWGAEVRRPVLKDGEIIAERHRLESWSVEVSFTGDNEAFVQGVERMVGAVGVFERDKLTEFYKEYENETPIIYQLCDWRVLRDEHGNAVLHETKTGCLVTLVKYAIVLPEISNPFAQVSDDEVLSFHTEKAINAPGLTVNKDGLAAVCLEPDDLDADVSTVCRQIIFDAIDWLKENTYLSTEDLLALAHDLKEKHTLS